MNDALQSVTLAFFIAVGGSLLLFPVALAWSRKYGLLVRPRLFGGARRGPQISYLGGVAIAVSTGITFVVFGATKQTAIILLGGLLLLLLGFVDDFRPGGISARWRFVVQVMLAVALAWTTYDGSLAKALFEVFVIVSVINAFNLIDNMDGVAGSTALGIAVGIAALSIASGELSTAVLAAAIAGSALAFLRYNFRRASLYLGNSGSLFLGFMLASLTFETGVRLGVGWELVGFVCILAVPTADMFVVTISRFLHGRSLFQGGTDHLSHRLAKLGLSTQQSAIAHGAAAVVGSLGVLVALWTGRPELLVGLVALFAAASFMLLGAKVYLRTPLRTWRVLGLSGVGLVSAFVLLSIAPALAAASDLHSSRAHFAKGAEALLAFDPETATNEFTSAGRSARDAERTLSSFLTLPARLLPISGPNIRLARDLAEAADLLTPAALDGIEALSAFPKDEAGRPMVGLENGRVRYEGWIAAKDYFDRAASVVRIALIRAQSQQGLILPPLSTARNEFISKGRDLLGALEGGSGLSEILPLLSGADGPRTWFLAIQNPVELRATGGFLGAFGILEADRGRIQLARLDSNLALPPLKEGVGGSPQFDARYARFASTRMWQNVNMTPDFPTAAEQMMAMWEAQSGQKVDGVIAIDAIGLSRLLEIVGPVQTADLGPVDSKNFTRLALNEAYVRFPEKAERADFLLTVGREAWSRLLTGSFENPLVLRPLAEAVAERHIFAWSPSSSTAFSNLKTSGTLKAPQKNTDFVLVVGQNAAANKVDYYMQRSINYQVKLLSNGRFEGDLRVDISNAAPKSGLVKYIAGPYLPTDPAGLNRSYTSIYVPPTHAVTSSIVNGKVAGVESHEEKGLAVYSNFVEALPGESSAMQVSMTGGKYKPGEYRLYVQKQPALRADRFTLELTLPPGAFASQTSPGMKVAGRKVRWAGTLETDKEFVVRYGSSLGDRLKELFDSDSGVIVSGSSLLDAESD